MVEVTVFILPSTAIYEASCEAHRRSTGLSGYFSIDPDGSGPLRSTLVYCNMTGELWMNKRVKTKLHQC